MSLPWSNLAGADVSGNLYKSVAALSVETDEQVIPNGETWHVRLMFANASYLDDVVVCLCWDYGGAGQEVIASSHGDMKFQLDRKLVGDGVKKLAIVLDNATPAARVIGVSWYGTLA